MTEVIVLSALIRIAQNFIGFGHFFEFLGAASLVGMVLFGEIAIGFFDIIATGLFGDTERFVIISLGQNFLFSSHLL